MIRTVNKQSSSTSVSRGLCVLKIDVTRTISDLRTIVFQLNQSCRLFR